MARSSAPKATGPGRLATGRPGESRSAEQAELAEVRAQLREAQQTIEAIRGGGIDSLMIGPPGQEQVYVLLSADRPYRLIVEAMNEGAATVSPRGVILNANPRLGAMTGQNATELVGTAVLDLIPDVHRPAFAALLDLGAGDSARGEVDLTGPGGTTVPVLLAVSGFDLDGMFLRCLVLTDLTTKRAAETEAARAHEALREQSAFLELRDRGKTLVFSTHQLDQAEELFEECPPLDARVIVMHHNPVRGELSQRHGLKNTQKILGAFAEMGVDLVCCGHDHQDTDKRGRLQHVHRSPPLLVGSLCLSVGLARGDWPLRRGGVVAVARARGRAAA
jgi:PAS domain S-box-containing protein